MTSLAEVYGETRDGPELQRLYLGTGLFVGGVALSLLAILVASTGVLYGFGFDLFGTRKIAGLLAGVGVPAVLMGVFTVLPTSRRIKAAAAIGASICILGVTMFWHAYPMYWVGSTAAKDLTLQVAGVYFVGLVTAGWCLFTAVVNFKTRNDPGGTVTMEVTREGETKVVEVPKSEIEDGSPSVGGVGMFGSTPDEHVETQTNRPDKSSGTTRRTGSTGATGSSASNEFGSIGASSSTGRTRARSSRGSEPGVGLQSSPTSDGGAASRDISSPMDETADAELLDDSTAPAPTDSYCGNCTHFDYIRDHGMQPYCAYHDETMEDMEACEQWAANNAGSRDL
jgi:membrane protein implicated in regulation of membrane protease activity